MKKYNYIIIGAGIAGCSLAYFLKQSSSSVLLIEKNSDVALGASGAAGAFLSPLLGLENSLKTLVAEALEFSMNIYQKEFGEFLSNYGTLRIPEDKEDEKKFEKYENFMDFPYEKRENGYFFPIGSVVNSYGICKGLIKDVETLFDYEVLKIVQNSDNFWVINNEIQADKLFLCTGADISLITEKYFDIRAIWGQRIDILSSTQTLYNMHKECSISKSKKEGNKNRISIGATHHRFEQEPKNTSYSLKIKNLNKIEHNDETKKIIEQDNIELLKKANDILKLDNVEVVDVKLGARASSIDYFPMVGELIDSEKSFAKYPHIKNGTHIVDENLITIKNLYTLNGVGARGFVLSLYLANSLAKFIFDGKKIDDNIANYRLFRRWAKKL